MESVKSLFVDNAIADTWWHATLAELLAIGAEVALMQPLRVIAAERMVGCSKQGLTGTALRVIDRDGASGLWKAGWASAARQLAERCSLYALAQLSDRFELLTSIKTDSQFRQAIFLAANAAALAPLTCAEQRLLVQHARREHAALPKYRHGVLRAAAMIRSEEGSRALYAHVPSSIGAVLLWLAASNAVSRVRALAELPRWCQWIAARALVLVAMHPALLVAAKSSANARTVPPAMRPRVRFASSLECVTEVVATHSITGLWAGLLSLGVAVVGGTLLKQLVRTSVASLLRALPDPPA
jgi:hypothetical protein